MSKCHVENSMSNVLSNAMSIALQSKTINKFKVLNKQKVMNQFQAKRACHMKWRTAWAKSPCRGEEQQRAKFLFRNQSQKALSYVVNNGMTKSQIPQIGWKKEKRRKIKAILPWHSELLAQFTLTIATGSLALSLSRFSLVSSIQISGIDSLGYPYMPWAQHKSVVRCVHYYWVISPTCRITLRHNLTTYPSTELGMAFDGR